MKIYKIKYNYNTGDSFHTERYLEETLEPSWTSLEIAKENLQRIKEHYEFYKGFNKYGEFTRLSLKESKKKRKEFSTKDWFVDGNYDGCLKLKMDNGEFVQIYAPWCGYFESLNSAKIIIEPDSDMEITF